MLANSPNCQDEPVLISLGDGRWEMGDGSQYAYQFSHELCHILCNYKESGKQNKWFEEALCEMASIYSLRRMAEDWKTRPPYPHWKGYSESLNAYAQDLIDKTSVPEDLAAWYQANKEHLSRNSGDRPKNRIVGVRLLPLFEKNPGLWQAVASLNKGARRNQQDFPAYLRAWHAHAPRRFGPQIAEIAAILGVGIDKTTPVLPSWPGEAQRSPLSGSPQGPPLSPHPKGKF